MEEIWKVIDGAPQYLISSFGRVKSLKRKEEKILSERKVNGYKVVGINFGKKRKQVKVHRLVAIAFIPNPEQKDQINHIDGNKQNNNVTNLEWCTRQENMKHAFENGLARKIQDICPKYWLGKKRI